LKVYMQTAALHNHTCITLCCLASLLVLFLRERNSSYHDNKTTYIIITFSTFFFLCHFHSGQLDLLWSI